VVHPGPGNWKSTLVNALLYHCGDLSSIGGTVRPGIVHRLDKDTSGLMVVAKTDSAHKRLVESFSSRDIHKEYAAIVTGKPVKDHGVIDRPLARHRKYRHKMTIDESGKEAVSEYWLKKIWNTDKYMFSLLSVKIHTGRTHQIRVHLSSSSLPIVGDPIYSKKWERYNVPYLLLASVALAFRHPETGEELSFTAPLPEHMQEFIRKVEMKTFREFDTAAADVDID
jgi:23S rRNA pseudouridine1911/1915/1917 synthase